MSAGYERRRAHRVPCAIEIEDVSGVETAACRATNISESGVYMRLRGGVLLEGERVSLALHLPDRGDPTQDPIWVSGEVVEQVQEPLHDAAAVRFDALSSGDRARLQAFVGRSRQARLGRALAGVSGLASSVAAPI